MNETDKKVLFLLNEIRKNYRIFIEKPSLELLRAFIDGYLSFQDKSPCNIMSDFQNFVETKFDHCAHHWTEIIEFYALYGKAFDAFFDLLDEFIQETYEKKDK